ncbi:DNA repair protein RAD51 homolog 2-like [Actinidia eriantha]|uniref:DNA repair protein RAD51 homolog 2-like n=1 Tax=Actinidia eriantha TaxID=165200 RepID=UPI00258E54C5|nr:DNA repair protein RAD51 homolog 2-like [Actinidia eriantha]
MANKLLSEMGLPKSMASIFTARNLLTAKATVAEVTCREFEQGPPRQHSLGWHILFIKSLAEFSQTPVVITNQVRSQSRDEISQYYFQVQRRDDIIKDPTRFDSHLVPALGSHWAHAVSIHLVLEAKSGESL